MGSFPETYYNDQEEKPDSTGSRKMSLEQIAMEVKFAAGYPKDFNCCYERS